VVDVKEEISHIHPQICSPSAVMAM